MKEDLRDLMIWDQELVDLTGIKMEVFQPAYPFDVVIIRDKNWMSILIPIKILASFIISVVAHLGWMVYGYYWDRAMLIYCDNGDRLNFILPFMFDIWKKFYCPLKYQVIAVQFLLVGGCVIFWVVNYKFAIELVNLIYEAHIIIIENLISQVSFKVTGREKHVKGILKKVQKYSQLIEDIYIKEGLESAEVRRTNLPDRAKVIEALQLTRLDLIRALRTERILWENKGSIQQDPAMFANNLEALESLTRTDKASEYGKFLNAALQVAIDTASVMEQLRNQRQ